MFSASTKRSSVNVTITFNKVPMRMIRDKNHLRTNYLDTFRLNFCTKIC